MSSTFSDYSDMKLDISYKKMGKKSQICGLNNMLREN